MAKVTERVEGLADLDKVLGELGKATGRNVLRRLAVKRLEPMAEEARRRVPVEDSDLKDSIAVSTNLAGYAKRLNSRSKSEAQASMGPAGRGDGKAPPQGSLQEFGTVNHPPQPFMRPAWDSGKGELLDAIADDLWSEISKAAARKAKKAARLAAKG
ncbi:HK97-gp10 family putative phage morphogenesis protein [Brevundimonas sp. TWP2-3-4b1]|uniref:HK97-gp10 family putative phage morphogenesis protein n=1 Tax=Brevundimonas sp. TWP2-3-4b1 TaxID=2804580 RepID=UPI003CF16193